MQLKNIPFVATPHINKEENLHTVEEVASIINQVENRHYISDESIIEEINKGELNARLIVEESAFTKTKYNVLIPDHEIIYLLADRYLINERYARSLLNALD